MVAIASVCCWALLSVQAPEAEPVSDALAVIVTERRVGGALPLQRLGLGDGGLDGDRLAAAGPRLGRTRTPGGVLVRAQAQGVKLDFPSGAELLAAPDGWLHGRDDRAHVARSGTYELWLADGTRVRIGLAGPRRPLAKVECIAGSRSLVLFRGRRPQLQWVAAPPPAPITVAVLGRGDVLYRAAATGPILTLERLVCPPAARRVYPEHRVVLAGAPLAASLVALPARVPPKPLEFPAAPAIAAEVARAAGVLFPTGFRERPPRAVGEVLFELSGGLRLWIDEEPEHGLALALGPPAGEAVVEWRCGSRTTLQLMRPPAEDDGGPRYFGRAVDLTDWVRPLWPLRPSAAGDAQVRAVLAALRRPRPVAAGFDAGR